MTDNGNGWTILLHRSLLYRIVEHSVHTFPSPEIPVQVFAWTALPYLKELLINLILILINSILKKFNYIPARSIFHTDSINNTWFNCLFCFTFNFFLLNFCENKFGKSSHTTTSTWWESPNCAGVRWIYFDISVDRRPIQ